MTKAASPAGRLRRKLTAGALALATAVGVVAASPAYAQDSAGSAGEPPAAAPAAARPTSELSASDQVPAGP